MATAQYTLSRDADVVPCDLPADKWLKAAPRGAYSNNQMVLFYWVLLQGLRLLLLQEHTLQLGQLARKKSSS